jgi:hypothetical protein
MQVAAYYLLPFTFPWCGGTFHCLVSNLRKVALRKVASARSGTSLPRCSSIALWMRHLLSQIFTQFFNSCLVCSCSERHNDTTSSVRDFLNSILCISQMKIISNNRYRTENKTTLCFLQISFFWITIYFCIRCGNVKQGEIRRSILKSTA